MKETEIYMISQIPSFTNTPDDDPMYFTNLCSYILVMNLKAMKEAGFTWQQAEETDGIEERQTPDALWLAQDRLIMQQSRFLDEVADQFAERRAELPLSTLEQVGRELLENLGGELLSALLGKWITAIPVVGEILERYIDNVGAFLVFLGFVAYDWLRVVYSAGSLLCERMSEENSQLLTLSHSWEHYDRRSSILTQHDHAIANIIAFAEAAERQARDTLGQQETVLEGSGTIPQVADFGFMKLLADGPLSSVVDG